MAENTHANEVKVSKKTDVLLNDSTKRIPKSQQIAYGFGDMGNGFMFDLGQAYLTKFWIDGTGISAGIVGAIFAFTKIFDAVMDPIVGAAVDNRKAGKHGKFRPVMMLSAILLAIMTVVTFTMPLGLSMNQKIMYALITYMIWGVFYSMTNDPYGSLASVMSRNLEDRSFMSTTRQIGSVAAQLIAGVAFIPLMTATSGGHPLHGYTISAAIFAVAGVLGFLVCFLGTRENLHVKRANGEKEGMKDYLKVVFTNGPLGALILMTLFTISAMNTNNQMMVFYAQYNLGNIGLQPIINFIMMGSSVAGVFMVPALTKHFGQKRTAIVSLFIGAVANAINFVLPTNLYTFILFVTIGYVALAIPNGITWAMVSNVIDYGEWHTGTRKEGITYAAFNFSRKIAQSIAALVSSGLLAITGYVANHAQTSAALNGIKIAMTLYPAICLALAGIILLLLFRLDDEKFTRISNDLDHGHWENGNL